MDNVSLTRGKEIERELDSIRYALTQLRDLENNPNGGDILQHGYNLSPEITEQIRKIAIDDLVTTRRNLQCEFAAL